jgi:hypothetical protein
MTDVPEVTAATRAEVAAAVAGRSGDALIESLAVLVQRYIDRAELAEMERQGAVETLRRHSEQVREIGVRGVVASWITCLRCGGRGPRSEDIRHAPGCTLSSRPPPRRSMPPTSGGEEG